MAKLDPYTLPRASRPVQTRTFEEPETGAKLTLTLRAPDAADAAKATESCEILVRDYIAGDDVRGAGPFPDPEVKPSASLFQTCCLIAEMQCPENPADRYDAIELAILSSKMPTAWAQVQKWVRALVYFWEQARGK